MASVTFGAAPSTMYGTVRLAVLPATSTACTVKLNLPGLLTATGLASVQLAMPERASAQLNGVPTNPFWANIRLGAAAVTVGASRSIWNEPLPVAPSSATASTGWTPLGVRCGWGGGW